MQQVRTVDTVLFKRWIRANAPRAVEELAIQARVSASLIRQVLGGRVPKKESREVICEATGYSEDELFPVVTAIGEDQAS
jgi:transcriptional regulator with XRE-family HTH domain